MSRKQWARLAITMSLFTLPIHWAAVFWMGHWPCSGVVHGIFTALSFVGHLSLLQILLACLPTLFLGWLLPSRLRHHAVWFLAVWHSTMIYYGVLDQQTHAVYRQHIDLLYFHMFFGEAGDEIFNVHILEYVVLFTNFFAVLLMVGSICYACMQKWLTIKHIRRWLMLIILAWLGAHLMHAIADACYKPDILQTARQWPLFYGLTAKRTIEKIPGIPKSWLHQRTNIKLSTGTQNFKYPKNPLKLNPKSDLPNILFILIDGWRFDSLTAQATPNLYQFAQKNLQFNHHLSGGNCTSAGVFSLMYGVPNHYWRASYHQGTGPVLIDTLKAHDYRWGIYASANLTSPPFHRTVFSQIPDLNLTTPGKEAYERDANITKRMLSFLKAPDSQPFFGFLFYDASHAYSIPPRRELTFKPSLKYINHFNLNPSYDRIPLFNLYLNTLQYIDELIAQVFHELKAQGQWDNTIIVLTGDHGEEFNDNQLNYWGHNSNFTPYQIHVPLILHWPKKSAHSFEHATSHFDVSPTLLQEIFGVVNPLQDYTIGQSLFDKHPRSVFLVEGYSKTGIIEPSQISVINPSGWVETMDHRAQPLPDKKPSSKAMAQLFKWLHQFY